MKTSLTLCSHSWWCKTLAHCSHFPDILSVLHLSPIMMDGWMDAYIQMVHRFNTDLIHIIRTPRNWFNHCWVYKHPQQWTTSRLAPSLRAAVMTQFLLGDQESSSCFTALCFKLTAQSEYLHFTIWIRSLSADGLGKADCILTFWPVNGGFYGLSQLKPDGVKVAASLLRAPTCFFSTSLFALACAAANLWNCCTKLWRESLLMIGSWWVCGQTEPYLDIILFPSLLSVLFRTYVKSIVFIQPSITNVTQGVLQSAQYTTPCIIRPSIRIKRNPPKKLLMGKKWKKPQEEEQRRDPSFRTDRHAAERICRFIWF